VGRLRELANEPLPYHLKRWWFALGSTPGYLFIILIVTGIGLAFYYKPDPRSAYESVRYITQEAAFGWYLRSIHKWAATLMVAAVVLHQIRTYFTNAYRKPREINWMIGVLLLFSTLMLGFTGYCLVYEQMSFWGATVAANIIETVPIAGSFVKQMLLGGDAYNARTLSRFFILHAAVLPIVMLVLIAAHLALVRLQGVTELSFEDDRRSGRKTFDFLPEHLYTELTVGLFLIVFLSALAGISPATMGPVADPNFTPEVIKPEWFFYVAFRWLKLFSGTAALLSIGLIVLAMLLWPFIDEQVRRRTRFREVSLWIGIGGVLAIVGLTLWEALARH
jgi:quinol-cytochrome oxidoreductase complex cytochrome b subunit